MPRTPQSFDQSPKPQNNISGGSYFNLPSRSAVTSAFRRMTSNPYGSKSQPQSRSSSQSRNASSDSWSSNWGSSQKQTQSSNKGSTSTYKNIMDMDMDEQAEDSDDMGDFVSGQHDFDEPTPSSNEKTNGSWFHHKLTTQSLTASLPSSTFASYNPSPRKTPPPFTPPPLTPLSLDTSTVDESSQLLSRLLAEEIRLLLPPRLQLVSTWNVIFNLERDGSSLKTLFEHCEEESGKRGGYVVVVKDGVQSVFGAYLSDAPAPSKGHYYGTGECFLWRSTIISSATLPSLNIGSLNLPPPPSADTTHATRMTTIGSPKSRRSNPWLDEGSSWNANGEGGLAPPPNPAAFQSGTSTPEQRIRFKAFPYSGVNDYMIFCEAGFLSVGGGDGHYGLWIDSSLERGISSGCPTFGNEPLSEEGEKFEVLGVEVWHVVAGP